MLGYTHPPDQRQTPPPPARWLLLRTVRILLDMHSCCLLQPNRRSKHDYYRSFQIWRGFSGSEDYDHSPGKDLWIWAPPNCHEAKDIGKEAYFTISTIRRFSFEEPRPPKYYDLGYNITVKKIHATVNDSINLFKISLWTRDFPCLR